MKIVVAALAVKNQCVLLARRDAQQKHAGFWEFPGGKVENQETLAQALCRELQEELGVIAQVGDEFARSQYHYPGGAIELVALWTEFDDSPMALRVHDAVQWVPIERLRDYGLTPADIPIAEKLITTQLKDAH
ncbi:CTP pyrophosphohydrolase [Vibrio stylophorae]|uniref:CTP pyrophosphohydrolase n=1 Tax=Vibrio stylophorae TaxID=659351 RepID=A0ABM8ZQ36_9VIBR|nr:(deoxy)nucleoside triphosphate pyrophosphohydrolase [Vibrio stylophorae]CAH0532410.1 CTP pyrophosphohydrolase [Vibrio stylophorae]